MTHLLPVLIVGWLGVAYFMFRWLPGAVATLAVVIVGQLFLPEIVAEPTVAGAPAALALPVLKFTKANTIGYALLFGSFLHDWRRWFALRPQWFDLPMALWCISPLIPAVNLGNGPLGGFYEGGNLTLNQAISWGVPYWCGRLYLGSLGGLRATVAAIVLGGMIYAPLVLYEWRMSPQLHNHLYGYQQHEFVQTMRDGGFRPMVFMEHGLMVALWMAITALTAFWLWHEGTFRVVGLHRSLPAIGLGWVALGLAGVTLMMHSAGAVVLGAAGAGSLLIARRLRTAVPLWILIILPAVYVSVRYTELWDGQDLVALAQHYASAERAQSLDFRLRNEYKLLNRAKEQPLFGWGDSGAAREVEGSTREKIVTDSMWIITVGNRGLIGLAAFLAVFMTPVIRVLWHHPPRTWLGAIDAPAAVLAVVLNLYLLDHMLNAMVNPAFMLVAGGLNGAAAFLTPLPVEEWPISVRDA
jgi:hypothetical protein